MNKISIVFSLFLCTLIFFSACAPQSVNPSAQSTKTTTAVQPTEQPAATLAAYETDLDELMAYYNDGYNTNTLIGMDQFGRVFEAAGNDREGKQVGIFYWPWFASHTSTSEKIYDNSKILQMENGLEILTSPELPDPIASPADEVHWWGEPLFGYYSSLDEWVLRRHLRMLGLAGVDYICLDCTNAVPFTTEIHLLLKCITELQDEGFKVPKLTVYTHYMSIKTLRTIYNNICRRGINMEGWYTYNGKPMVIAYDNIEDDKKATGVSGYNPKPLSEDILQYFTFVRPEWPNEYKTYRDSIAWCEWIYPAPVHKDFNCITVSPAAHPGCPFSFSLTGRSTNWGRGWDPATKTNKHEDIQKGTFFQKNWDVALEKDPDMVYIGGWNEWTMTKFLYGGEYVLVDNVNLEYSRDLEPMKGEANDAYYIQMTDNIRRYKKLEVTKAKFDPVTPNADFDWKNTAVFRKLEAVNKARDHIGAAQDVYYTQAAARNNVKEIRVVTDKYNLYFRIACDKEITQYGKNWMNLFIGTGELCQKGWEGYEYVVNRAGKGKISALNAKFELARVGTAQVDVDKNVMLITVPRSALGLSQNDNSFYFKVADNIEKPSDIMDYYVSGCSVPMGRFSFRYVG